MIRKLGNWHIDDREIVGVSEPRDIEGLGPGNTYLTIILRGGASIHIEDSAEELVALQKEIVGCLTSRHNNQPQVVNAGQTAEVVTGEITNLSIERLG